jgi:hypothetical protein
MSTDELARRIRVLRDQLIALDRAERAWREQHDAARKRIADEIEAEHAAAGKDAPKDDG